MHYQKVISLGPSCETAWQIRQTVDQPEAYVFDWVIAPATSVAAAIRSDYNSMVRPDRLTYCPGEAGGHPFIRDEATGIEYHHDFRNDPAFMDTFDDVQGKYDYLKSRMRATLAEQTVLFVHKRDNDGDAAVLRDALIDRYPGLSFRILSVDLNGRNNYHDDGGRIIVADIPGNGASWQERQEEWRLLIERALGDSLGTGVAPLAADRRGQA